jgi:hypothetical protein
MVSGVLMERVDIYLKEFATNTIDGRNHRRVGYRDMIGTSPHNISILSMKVSIPLWRMTIVYK